MARDLSNKDTSHLAIFEQIDRIKIIFSDVWSEPIYIDSVLNIPEADP